MRKQPGDAPAHLYGLHLLADSTQHFLAEPVELVKAAEGAAAQQAHKDAPHGSHIKLLVAVEHQHLMHARPIGDSRASDSVKGRCGRKDSILTMARRGLKQGKQRGCKEGENKETSLSVL